MLKGHGQRPQDCLEAGIPGVVTATYGNPRAKAGTLQALLYPGLWDKPVAAGQRRLGPSAKLPCFLHLRAYGVTELSLGERGTARPRPGHPILTDNLCQLLQGFNGEHGMFLGV